MDQAEILPKRHVLTPRLIMTQTAFNTPAKSGQQQSSLLSFSPRPIHEAVWKLGWQAWRQRMA
jgi:hypothetical protein